MSAKASTAAPGDPETGILPVPALMQIGIGCYGRCYKDWCRCRDRPATRTSSIREAAPARQSTPTARGFAPPASTPKPLRIFEPQRAPRSPRAAGPRPGHAGVSSGRRTESDVGCSPISTVSGFNGERVAHM